MSYSISYNSFNKKKADDNWAKFDILFNEAIKREEKMDKLRAVLDSLLITDEEIYDPQFKEQALNKNNQRKNIRNDLEKTREDQPSFWSDLICLKNNKDPIDDYILIEADLNFGGEEATFCSSIDNINGFDKTLAILFPELKLKDNKDLNKEDFIGLFKYLSEFDNRFKIYNDDICQKLSLSEEEIDEWEKEVKEMFLKLVPVVEDIANGSDFLYRVDGDIISNKDLKLLFEERAIKHIRVVYNDQGDD